MTIQELIDQLRQAPEEAGQAPNQRRKGMYIWASLNRLFATGAIPARMILFFDKPWAEARVYDAAAALLAADNASFEAKIAAYRREVI